MSRVDVDAVKQAWPLTDTLVRRYGIPLQSAGRHRLRARCPLPGHERDSDPSFVVYAEQESFYCYGCHRGGDVVTLVRALEGLDFRAAVDRLTDGRPPRAAPPASMRPPTRPPPESAVGADSATHDALVETVDFYARRLAADAPALAYLGTRGLSRATIARRQLGLAGDLTDYLAWQRRPRAPFARAGLLGPDGRERLAGRIVIPELIDGQPTWLTGRLLPGLASPSPAQPRYESVPGPRPLLGLGGLPPSRAWVVLVEGPFDALLLDEWGYPAVALGGSAGTRAHLEQLSQFGRVLLALDHDAAGARATSHLATALGERAANVPLPAGVKDIGDLAAWPDGRHRLAAALAPLIPE